MALQNPYGWGNDIKLIKSQTKKENNMKKKTYWQQLGIVSLWGTGILFGIIMGLTLIISFISWNFNFYETIITWFFNNGNIVRSIFIAILAVFAVIAFARTGEDTKKKSW